MRIRIRLFVRSCFLAIHSVFQSNLRKFICCFLVLCIIFSCSVTFKADASSLSKRNYNEVLTVINNYSTDKDIFYSVSSYKQLRSLSSGDETYTLYELYPYGYAILFDETNSLMEASYAADSQTPVNTNTNDVVYYGGPNRMFVFRDGSYVDINRNIALSDIELDALINTESRVRTFEESKLNNFQGLSKGSREGNLVTYSVAENYFMDLTEFPENTNGTCTIVALAMLLGYYNYSINDSYVPSIYESGNGTNEDFHSYLNLLIHGTTTPNNGAIYIRDTTTDINRYLDGLGLTVSLRAKYFFFINSLLTDGIIGKIQNQTPVIASMETLRGAPYNHTVLIYSVQYDPDDPTGTACYTAHMGWSGHAFYRYVVLNHSWFYEYGYLECNLMNHEADDGWEIYNSATHRRLCDCGVTAYESHDVYLLSNDFCVRCQEYIN